MTSGVLIYEYGCFVYCRCFSYVGKVFEGGQVLSIGVYCDRLAIVEHEILHALGFYHEQSRPDRDDYVKIVFENIQSGSTTN